MLNFKRTKNIFWKSTSNLNDESIKLKLYEFKQIDYSPQTLI